jgi:hypothetical protein
MWRYVIPPIIGVLLLLQCWGTIRADLQADNSLASAAVDCVQLGGQSVAACAALPLCAWQLPMNASAMNASAQMRSAGLLDRCTLSDVAPAGASPCAHMNLPDGLVFDVVSQAAPATAAAGAVNLLAVRREAAQVH